MKAFYQPSVVAEMAARLAANHPALPVDRLVAEVVADFPALELLGRARRIAQGLRDHLPPSFPDALEILLASMGPEDAQGGMDGMSGFRHLPFLNFVGLYGLEHPDLALDALERMTCHFSAEFDIRPFILTHPDITIPRLRQWAHHPDWRVRRVASEGSRPRLPWGVRLKPFVLDPTAGLEIIEPLRGDPHPVVRRSVANHLNDVAKDHPERVVACLGRWLQEPNPHARWIAGHALRTLIKQGHPQALALMGFGGLQAPRCLSFRVEPERIVLGEDVTLAVELRCLEDAKLSIDYALYHRRLKGSLARKVFKWTVREVRAGQVLRLEKRHPMRRITTRKYYPGMHRLELLVNGVAVGEGGFELT
ncbi:MAG: DNA alkylation repair protein [Magnetococcales bacterium]|nr:DNA alkylation repair protein [Magnetococcales bacterium]